MGIPELAPPSSHEDSRIPPLFGRLPSKLFTPLASQNREQYWAILTRLHAEKFGPDAPLPPSKGYTHREVVVDIEQELQLQDHWSAEGEDAETPNGIRANMVFNRILDAGWLRIDRHGVERTVSMRPVVSHFLTQLVNFAERGPVFVSGKVNVIEASLREVAEGKKLGDVLGEVAQSSRDLLEHIRNTSNIIRELMESLSADMPTAQYVRSFFTHYIERVFIGDYRELRTREHPLSRRQHILRMVESIDETTELRDRLVSWYVQNRASGDISRAERLYARDMQRLRDLSRIDEYLARLDDEIRRANRRALAFLDYKMRAVYSLDTKIRHAIEQVIASNTVSHDPFSPGEMISAIRLAEPRKAIDRPDSTALRKITASPIDLARARVLHRARDARTISAPKLAAFVDRVTGDSGRIDNKQIPLETVADIRAYQTLSVYATVMATKSKRLHQNAKSMLRGFTVESTGQTEDPHQLISGKSFMVFKSTLRKKGEV